MCSENFPKLNPYVMEGLGTLYMSRVEEYIHQVFLSASKSLPPGLEYVGYERCTHQEEFEEITRPKNNKRIFDLARSDLYLVKYKFTFEGSPLPDRYVYLPFVNDGGIFYLGGTPYHITPVLSDKVISPGFDNIFVRLLRDKIIFKRCYHTVVIDGVVENTHVVWSQIYRKHRDNKKVPITTRAETCLVHYLFAKFGFNETFEKYAGFTPTIGYDTDITPEKYPDTDWIICSSQKVPPRSYIGSSYFATKLRLAIPRSKWNSITKALVIGFFYIVDHFPDRFKLGYEKDKKLWMILLGHIIFSGVYGENKLYKSIEDHFVSLDDYVDSIIIEKLKETGKHVCDFYDLMALILGDFNNLIHDSENTAMSMYGKNLEVLYYVLYDITKGIFKVNFSLSKLISKKRLTKDDVISAFNKNMKMGAIYGLSSGKIISEPVSYSGDHKYPKITSKITEQESLPGANRGKSKRLSVGKDKHLDISMVEAGSVLFLSKSNPTPTNRVNMFVNLDLKTGTIVPNPELKPILQKTQKLLKGQK